MGDTSNPSNQPSIGDLVNGMKRQDFRLTPTAAHNYLQAIGTFKKTLNGCRNQAADLANPDNYGNPGGFVSATQTRDKLRGAVTDANNGCVPNLDRYITYLEEAEGKLHALLTRFQAEDNS